MWLGCVGRSAACVSLPLPSTSVFAFQFFPQRCPQCQVLLYRTLEREFKRISTRATLRKNLRRKCFRPKSRFIREFTREMPQTKIGMHSLCESEHSKCTCACHESHFRREFSGKKCWGQDRDAQFVLAPSKRTWACDKRHFRWEFRGKMLGPRSGRTVCAWAVETHKKTSQEPFYVRICTKSAGAKIGTHSLCELAQQSKRRWTCHNSRSVAIVCENLSKKYGADQDRDAQFVRACAIETHMDMSQKLFDARIDKKNARDQTEDLLEIPVRSFLRGPCMRSLQY